MIPRIIALIDPHALRRQCMVRSLEAFGPNSIITQHASPEEWLANDKIKSGGQVVIYCASNDISSPQGKEKLRDFIDGARPSKVIVISQSDDLSCVLDAIECGAVSYIPAAASLDDLVEALRMSMSGNIFVKRESFMALRSMCKPEAETKPPLESYFTERQLAVARALQRGAANKTIAYELNLCESTVKVHIRNIMRKLKATNRTQAAFKLNAFASGPDGPAKG